MDAKTLTIAASIAFSSFLIGKPLSRAFAYPNGNEYKKSSFNKHQKHNQANFLEVSQKTNSNSVMPVDWSSGISNRTTDISKLEDGTYRIEIKRNSFALLDVKGLESKRAAKQISKTWLKQAQIDFDGIFEHMSPNNKDIKFQRWDFSYVHYKSMPPLDINNPFVSFDGAHEQIEIKDANHKYFKMVASLDIDTVKKLFQRMESLANNYGSKNNLEDYSIVNLPSHSEGIRSIDVNDLKSDRSASFYKRELILRAPEFGNIHHVVFTTGEEGLKYCLDHIGISSFQNNNLNKSSQYHGNLNPSR